MAALRAALVVVFDRHLALGVGAQVGHQLPFAADDGQLLQDHMRKNQRRGHHFARPVAGIAEHDPLVARALFLFGGAHDALVDVGRLFVDGRQDAARVGIELVVAPVIADAVDDAARYALHVDVGLRPHFARDDHQTGGAERFAGDLRVGVVA